MQHTWFLLVAGVALAWNSKAHAGAPSWCKGTSQFKADDYASAKDDIDRVRQLVNDCQPDAAGAFQKALAEESKRLSMTDADWNDAVAWDNAQGYSSVDLKMQGTSFATLSPIDQYLAIRKGVENGHNGADALYMADALDQKLTEAGRLAFLESCNLGGNPQPWLWAICLPDAAKLNAAKFGTEIRGDSSHTPVERFALRMKLGKMIDNLEHFKQAGPELIKKDDGYKKLFDAAAQGRLDWEKSAEGMTDLLALAEQVDSAWYFHSKKQYAGCEDKTEKALAAAVSTFPAKTFEGLRDDEKDMLGGFLNSALPKLMANPRLSLAANAFVMCEPDRGWSQALAVGLTATPGYRGPRGASYSAIASQKFELDDTRAKEIEVPRPDVRPYAKWDHVHTLSGIVSALKPGKDKDPKTGDATVIVSQPKTSMTTEDCVKWHSTNKMTGWDTAGRPTYEEICDKLSMVKHDTTPTDWTVSAKSAAMLKPGVRFSVTAYGGREVVAVWPSKTAKLPSMVLGAAVK